MPKSRCSHCGQVSDFDPPAEAAQCPHRGYTLTQSGGVAAGNRKSGKNKPDAVRDEIVQVYENTKDAAGRVIIMVRQDDHFYTFGSDAETLAGLCGSDLLVASTFAGSRDPTARTPYDQITAYWSQLAEAGHQAGTPFFARLTCPQCGQQNSVKDPWPPAIYCPQCGHLPAEAITYYEYLFARAREAHEHGDKVLARFIIAERLQHAHPDYRAAGWLLLGEMSTNLDEKQECLQRALACEPENEEVKKEMTKFESFVAAHTGKTLPAESLEILPDQRQPIQTRRFVCSRCGGEMAFSADKSALTCLYCDFRLESATGGTLDEQALEQSFHEAMADLSGHARSVRTRTFACRACGCVYTLSSEILSFACPYCASNYVIERVEYMKLIPPTGLIPFAVPEAQALQAIKHWLARQVSDSETSLASLTGFYFPVWTFDLKGMIGWSGTVRVARVIPFTVSGSESVSYDDVLVPASHKLPEDLLVTMDTYDLQKLAFPDPSYLADWPAEMYSLAMSDASLEARRKSILLLQRYLERSHEKIFDLRFRSADLKVKSFKLVFLPMWLARYRIKGKTYQAIVNGQTGSVHAERPENLENVVEASDMHLPPQATGRYGWLARIENAVAGGLLSLLVCLVLLSISEIDWLLDWIIELMVAGAGMLLRTVYRWELGTIFNKLPIDVIVYNAVYYFLAGFLPPLFTRRVAPILLTWLLAILASTLMGWLGLTLLGLVG